jgi:hypothetical protein
MIRALAYKVMPAFFSSHSKSPSAGPFARTSVHPVFRAALALCPICREQAESNTKRLYGRRRALSSHVNGADKTSSAYYDSDTIAAIVTGEALRTR